MTYRADLYNSAGKLDGFACPDLESLAQEIAGQLSSGQWLLADGDTIRITARDEDRL